MGGRAADAPLGPAEFEAAFDRCAGNAAGLLVAVSGGPDSTCLMHLVAALRTRPGFPPVAVATVDHGLRPGSAAEAASVEARAAALGLRCHRLAWTGPKPARAIQERARQARYALLAACCRGLGATHLLTAHTRDDQAETVLLRLTRGSGVAGLAGMSDATARNGVTLARPLLDVPKSRLVATCQQRGWRFVRDPSNDDPRFARVRLRGLAPLLAREGLHADALLRLAARAARADAALAEAASRVCAACARASPPGFVSFDGAALLREPAEIVIRVLARAVADPGRGRHVRLDRLERLAADLAGAATAGAPLRRTLGGFLVRLDADRSLVLRPEPRRSRGQVLPAKNVHAVSDQAGCGATAAYPSLGKAEPGT